MSDYDFVEKINSSYKDIKMNWEDLVLAAKNNTATKDNVRTFKSNLLIPTLNRISDLAALIIERKRNDLYKDITSFFKKVIEMSAYYQRKKKNISFNYSTESEHLSCLLPGYESTILMFKLGAIATAEENFEFLTELGDEKVLWVKTSDGKYIYRSIFYYPWYENTYGVGNLTTFFNEARYSLEKDEYIIKRYFSILDDDALNKLCQFNFLQCLKVELQKQNDWEDYPLYPNFARYYFFRVDNIIQKFLNRDAELLHSFPVNPDMFKLFLRNYIKYTKNHFDDFGITWLDDIPGPIIEYINS